MPASIKVEDLSKCYRLGQSSAKTLGELVGSAAGRLFGRSRGHSHSKAQTALKTSTALNSVQIDSNGDFWALREISLEIEPGDVIGIIGPNGAGKSTLLKILSRITPPTSGRVELNGRVASLLEVGTGFHPELTGRENVYLNGAVLGMTKSEIRRRFDEIVDFSGISDFIETPVKRYSSGMYVRLAFAVAAHLDPEILVVDEVLAVGDAQFQAKCLKKLRETSQQARTVLFVSHNLHAIASLCSRALLLHDGRIKSLGETSAVVSEYLSELEPAEIAGISTPADSTAAIAFTGRSFVDRFGRPTSTIPFDEPISISLEYRIAEPPAHYRIGIHLETSTGIGVSDFTTEEWPDLVLPLSPGEHRVVVRLPESLLGPGDYCISCSIDQPGFCVFDNRARWGRFSVVGNPLPRNRPWQGIISMPVEWQVEQAQESLL